MAIFGSGRDISFFKNISQELVDKIIEQKVGYYKIDLEATQTNIYGEASEKFYKDPILINCLIERGDKTAVVEELNITVTKTITVRFLKDTLKITDTLPEIGDVILWNELYFEVNNVNENQYVMGKDPDYSLDPTLDDFGNSFSIIVMATYVRPERFGIKQSKL